MVRLRRTMRSQSKSKAPSPRRTNPKRTVPRCVACLALRRCRSQSSSNLVRYVRLVAGGAPEPLSADARPRAGAACRARMLPVDAFVTSAAGVVTPRLLYGTAWKKAETARLVTLALQEGFRGIDTACQPRHYDEPGVGAGIEAAVGEALSRSDLYLQTKFTPIRGQDPARVPYDPHAPLAAQVTQSFAASLR